MSKIADDEHLLGRRHPFGLHLLHLLLAFLLALPIGWDREQAARSAGLRTFPLVAIDSCRFVLIERRVLDSDPQARIIEGLMIGIGFIGGGAILKSKASVRGTATAASIWLLARSARRWPTTCSISRWLQE